MGCIKCTAARQQREQNARELKERMRLGPMRYQAVSKFLAARKMTLHPRVTKPVEPPKPQKGKNKDKKVVEKEAPKKEKKNQEKKGKGNKKDQNKKNNNKK